MVLIVHVRRRVIETCMIKPLGIVCRDIFIPLDIYEGGYGCGEKTGLCGVRVGCERIRKIKNSKKKRKYRSG